MQIFSACEWTRVINYQRPSFSFFFNKFKVQILVCYHLSQTEFGTKVWIHVRKSLGQNINLAINDTQCEIISQW
jgi:hypothetical protein